MNISPFFKILGCSLVAVVLSSCASGPDYAGGVQRPYVPRVAMPDPSRLSQNEQRYLPEVENALEDAGYRPTQGGDAEYRVDIHLEDGPVNADSRLTMFRGGSEIARAYARAGGATMIFRRQQFVNESFQKCLNDFVAQVPRVGSGRSYRADSRDPYESRGSYEQPQSDWQRGW